MNIKRIGLIGGSGIGRGTSSGDNESENSIWKVQNNILVSQDSNRNITLGSNVSIGVDNYVELDNDGIFIGNSNSPKVIIGSSVVICRDSTESLQISSAGIRVYNPSQVEGSHIYISESVYIDNNVTIKSGVYIDSSFDTRRYFDSNNDLISACIPTDSSLKNSSKLAVNIEPQSNGNIKIGDTLFMPATPSGDPLHYAYETAGAEYNATTDFIVKDAPWKDMVDTIEDKAKWGFDVVDASQVKQMTIGGTTYNYVQTTRQSPENTVEPRYFLVGQASDGTWVEDETKVLHLPGHWYLNGLGDITNAEMRRAHNSHIVSATIDRGLQDTKARTLIFNELRADITLSTISINSSWLISIIGPKNGILATPVYFDTFLAKPTKYCYTLRWDSKTGSNYTPISAGSQARVFYLKNIAKFVKVLSKNLSKSSIMYMIDNAAPTTAITITLHADRYSQLAEDADIVAALQAKNTALEGTGGSISLVSA